MEDAKRGSIGLRRFMAICCMAALPAVATGCSHYESLRAQAAFEEAALLSGQGQDQASLQRYRQIIAQYPSQEDRAWFEMGLVHAHPKNEPRDYQKSLQCFERILSSHPASDYRQDSEMMKFYIENVAQKDEVIALQGTRIEKMQRQLETRDDEAAALLRKIASLEKKVFDLVLQYGTADKVLIEKKQRRLLLMSRGEVIKSYKVALGGDPVGPKEQMGDNKTPEGVYRIEAKNRDSQYHLALRISYPNEADKKRAKQLGAEPGGDIMIHGIKNGFTWIGELHSLRDWTHGCIAVTDEEIEEIDKLTPVGTAVEITP